MFNFNFNKMEKFNNELLEHLYNDDQIECLICNKLITDEEFCSQVCYFTHKSK